MVTDVSIVRVVTVVKLSFSAKDLVCLRSNKKQKFRQQAVRAPYFHLGLQSFHYSKMITGFVGKSATQYLSSGFQVLIISWCPCQKPGMQTENDHQVENRLLFTIHYFQPRIAHMMFINKIAWNELLLKVNRGAFCQVAWGNEATFIYLFIEESLSGLCCVGWICSACKHGKSNMNGSHWQPVLARRFQRHLLEMVTRNCLLNWKYKNWTPDGRLKAGSVACVAVAPSAPHIKTDLSASTNYSRATFLVTFKIFLKPSVWWINTFQSVQRLFRWSDGEHYLSEMPLSQTTCTWSGRSWPRSNKVANLPKEVVRKVTKGHSFLAFLHNGKPRTWSTFHLQLHMIFFKLCERRENKLILTVHPLCHLKL